MASVPTSRLGKFTKTVFGDETVKAFLPPPLPPTPPVNLQPFTELIDLATTAIGRLDGITAILPDPPLFIYMYVQKEALLSSQIEGTQSSLSDLLLLDSSDITGATFDDAVEVSSYVAAMYEGLRRLKQDLPLSLRLIREIHAVLLRNGRGSNKQPGEFRRTQNWIGGSRPGNATFVPPPPERLIEFLGELENFIRSPSPGIPILVKAALVHVQFETIHPFLDGNGRLGRLLITFLLCADGILKEPILYLSLFFKTHRQLYYDLLMRVRLEGDWESWVQFFLEGIIETSNQATQSARQLLSLFETDRKKIAATGRSAATVLRVHELLQKKPLVTIGGVSEELGMTLPTVKSALNKLEHLGIVKETTGKQRYRRYIYKKYMDILSEGTEPLPR